MKGFIAFIAHCPELRENQRVVVVGECPELGGWKLGGALSLSPAPCGRPWWALGEVKVNLPESTMGVAGDFVNSVGTGEEGGGLGVSELKFRLLAIPNDWQCTELKFRLLAIPNDWQCTELEVPHPCDFVSLEPLMEGDFHIVHLVGAPPLSDRSSVGARGVNTIHVCAEGGEGQEREVVGISVEWGVAESVQLALLPLPTNRQTENLHREYQHNGLSESQSEIACPPFSEERTEKTSRIEKGSGGSEGVPICRPQSAVKSQRSYHDRGSDEGNHPADFVSDHPPTLPPQPSNSLQLPTRVRIHHVQSEERQSGKADVLAVSMKRRQPESALTQVDANECDEESGCPGERKGGGLWREGREGREGECLRQEKQHRLTVSLSDSAPLSSELCRRRGDLIAGGRGGVSENDCRRGEGGEVKRNRHGQILCLHGRVRTRCKECGGGSICEHGRIRSQCKECGGKSLCEHGRPRHQCKECGGKGICEHGRPRHQCKECGGKGIYEHGRLRHQCKECGGKGICEHGRIRSQCKECGGKGICKHGRLRHQCKGCGGKGICEHGRIRSR
uniref:CBM20 domain-containing protein n=1 Tax=Chromera velia CCMP2878 TaxID=1169474 RepID=A0A0G4HRW6_9ALVE|eukprot:Cvel_8198.t1-p1 / transcript=Cvel_8198.t1 / gene=Cvel_8198 / organism=Chromera_velia_CCMP2878 / gene_product=Zinc finger protein 283, putative / transcript_product=Zinc finger protein 283, putative / location=Cvel_scaffold447:9063-10745(+) / protein_length=561 / sequence_SO=supercontig / SO=protein_coding / is_pseudo=false